MRVLGVDPGTRMSGMLLYDTDTEEVLHSEEVDNKDLLDALRSAKLCGVFDTGDIELAIEDIEGMGLMVGKDVFETCIWIGRFIEAWEYNHGGSEAHRISRGDEKIVICGCKTVINPQTGKRKAVSDSMIRKAVIEKFPASGGGKTPQVGTKKLPGPLYGVKGHCWSALAIVITYLETR